MFNPALIVKHAIFEKEVFLDRIPPGAKKQVFDLKLDGENYVLGVFPSLEAPRPTVTTGSFNGLPWEASDSGLILSDPKINTNRTATSAQEVTTRLTANTFLNLGIHELVRKSVVWDEANSRIVATSTDGSEIVVELQKEEGVPVKAMIRSSRHKGEAAAYIRYEYDPKFFGGKLPVAFTRFYNGAPNEDVGKILTIRIKKLDLGEQSLPQETLNPQELFKQVAAKSTIFYSNDAPYMAGFGDKGKPQKILTAEEYYKSMEVFAKRPGVTIARRNVIRGVLVFLLVVGGGYLPADS